MYSYLMERLGETYFTDDLTIISHLKNIITTAPAAVQRTTLQLFFAITSEKIIAGEGGELLEFLPQLHEIASFKLVIGEFKKSLEADSRRLTSLLLGVIRARRIDFLEPLKDVINSDYIVEVGEGLQLMLVTINPLEERR